MRSAERGMRTRNDGVRVPPQALRISLAPLKRSFYDRHVALMARDLLGKLLVREHPPGVTVGRIVETEAYLSQEDTACHASRGMTPRNTVMFGPAGHAYVYAIHSRFCLNVVADAEQVASAVLIRAVEPLRGIKLMQERRGTEKLFDLARGPARLCEAFAIDRQQNGWDLTRGKELWIAEDQEGAVLPHQILVTPRIGVTSAHELPLRFVIAGNPFVSGRKSLARQGYSA
jgi:DNA-3-methyladenine glycosylase